MRVKSYILLAECVERGVTLGINRCRKHDTNADSKAGQQRISDAVLECVGEYFEFEPGDGEDG